MSSSGSRRPPARWPASGQRRGPVLLRGRQHECDLLDPLVEAVRGGESRALVLRGDPGVGKTALLEYLVGRATGCRVARAAGVETEMELVYSGLHQLLTPMLGRLERLSAPQADALATAFGLSAGAAPDRFLVGLATLSLLADAAEDHPLLCLVDDAQWLDTGSAQALAFAARRLEADPVGVVFAARTPGPELAGLPELAVGGLPEPDARELLDSVLTGPLDPQVRDRVVAEAAGNPLALVELPRDVGPAGLAGGYALPDAPLASRLEASFRRRLEALPADTRRLLRLAAAEPVGDPVLMWRAAERLGISAGAGITAAEAGLLEVGARVLFRHPLVRSAAYRSASRQERQELHRALAEATDPGLDPDRRRAAVAGAAAVPSRARPATAARANLRMVTVMEYVPSATAPTTGPARRNRSA